MSKRPPSKRVIGLSIVLALGVVINVGCGKGDTLLSTSDSETASASALPEPCDPDDSQPGIAIDAEPFPLSSQLGSIDGLVLVESSRYSFTEQAPKDISGPASPNLVTLTGPLFLARSGTDPNVVDGGLYYLTGDLYRAIERELKAGSTLVVPIRNDPVDKSATIPFLLWTTVEGELLVTDPCSPDDLQGQLNSFMASDESVRSVGGPAEAEFVKQLLDERARNALVERLAANINSQAPPTPTTRLPWSARDPFDRKVDDADVPAEEWAKLERGFVTYELPKAWLGSEMLLCTRNSSAWNPCVQLNSEPAKSGTVSLHTYGIPGEPIEIYLLGEGSADALRAPVGILGSFRLEGRTDVALFVASPWSEAPPDALRAAASKGETVFVER